jgi:hypothetical protein
VSDTPRTDGNAMHPITASGLITKTTAGVLAADGVFIFADFARTLERELAEARTELVRKDEALRIAEQALFELRGSYECRGDYYEGWACDALRKITALKTPATGQEETKS